MFIRSFRLPTGLLRHALCLLCAFAAASLNGQQPVERSPLWTFEVGAIIYSSVAVDKDGNLYFGAEDNRLYSLTPAGAARWSYPTGDWIDASPAIGADGSIYFGSWDHSLYALSPDGKLKWRYETGAFIHSSPAIGPDGTVYFGSTDDFFYALDGQTGEVLWTYLTTSPLFSSPAIGPDGTIYIGCEQEIYNDQDELEQTQGVLLALNPDGSLRWKYTVPTNTGGDSRILGSPAIDLDGRIVFGTGNNLLIALNPNGNPAWTPLALDDKVDTSPAISEEGTIYVATRNGFLYAIDVNGFPAWTAPVDIGDTFYCSPAIDSSGNLYIASFVGNYTSRIYCINPAGDVLWFYDVINLIDASPSLTPDNRLYLGGYDGMLYAFQTDAGLATGGWPKFRLTTNNDANLDPGSTDHLAYFPESVELDDGWFWTTSIGFYFAPLFPWVYTNEHRWWYCYGSGDEDMWMYDFAPEIGWFWTSHVTWPLLFTTTTAEWLQYDPGSVNPRRFWDFNLGENGGWLEID